MKKPFYVKGEEDHVAIIRYRLECAETECEGMVVEDAVEFPVDSTGRFTKGIPKADDIVNELLIRLLDIRFHYKRTFVNG